MRDKRKIINDLVHGYIDICSSTETIINCESFQRLKFIRQLTALHLFPSASHSRFDHSLGVMKLSLIVFFKIKHELKDKIIAQDALKNKKNNKKEDWTIDSYIEFLKIHLQYASLLHDVGHAPFSHVGEKLYNKEEIKEKLTSIAKENDIKFVEEIFNNGSLHELMSCYVILRNFRNKLDAIVENIDYDFIFRIITGTSYSKKDWEKNIVISILNSRTLDVDKLDYLMRDNLMCGNVGPSIDLNRLLESLTITNYNNLAFRTVGLSTIQKVIDCRDSIYMWVCNHHTVVYTDYIYLECMKHFINLKIKFNDKFPERIEFNDLFSCEAIADRNVTDNEAHYYIRRAMTLSKQGKASKYTTVLINQLLGRSFLKPTWKTLYEYTEFIKVNFDNFEEKNIVKHIEDIENRRLIVNAIRKKLNIELGELFLVVRPNKFYITEVKNFYIYHKDKNISLTKLLPQRDYHEVYDEVAFYIYAKPELIDKVKELFVEIIKKKINE